MNNNTNGSASKKNIIKKYRTENRLKFKRCESCKCWMPYKKESKRTCSDECRASFLYGEKRCLSCDGNFSSIDKNSKYCSLDCYRDDRKKQKEKEIIEFKKEGWLHKDIASKLKVCGKKVAKVLKENDMHIKVRKVNCRNCNTAFKTKSVHALFCKDKCRMQYNKKNRGTLKECQWCKREFRSYGHKLYCSKECREETQNYNRLVRLKQQEVIKINKEIKKLSNVFRNVLVERKRTCGYCEKEFIMVKGKTGNKYCSNECSELSVKRRAKKKRRSKDKRWRTNGKPDYSITLDKLHIKYNGICHLCGNQTNYSDMYINDEGHYIAGDSYPSIDHLVPISKGGTHTWDNVRLAHRLCNSLKGNKHEKREREFLQLELFV